MARLKHQLFETEKPGSVWVKDLPRLCEVMGDALLADFLRLFLWSDRLVTASLAMTDAYERKEVDRAAALDRDVNTHFVTVCCALHETAVAIEDLIADGVEGMVADQTPMKEASAFVARWRSAGLPKRVRDKLGSHIDQKLIRDGLSKLRKEGHDKYLFLMGTTTVRRTQVFKLAHDVAWKGLFADQGSDLDPTLGTLDEEKARLIVQLVGEVVGDQLALEDLATRLFFAVVKGLEEGRTATPRPRWEPEGARETLEKVSQEVRKAVRTLPGFDHDAPLMDQITSGDTSKPATRGRVKTGHHGRGGPRRLLRV